MATRLFITKELKSSKQQNMANCLNYLYYFRRYNIKSTTTNWVCYEKNCNASITTSNEDEVIKINNKNIKEFNEDLNQILTSSHEHDPQSQAYIDSLVELSILKLEAQTSTKSLSELYTNVQSKLLPKHGLEEVAEKSKSKS